MAPARQGPYDASMFTILSSKRAFIPSSAVQKDAVRDKRQANTWPDPLPLPDVVEDDSDAAWALWQATVQGQSTQDADTVLMGLTPL